MAMLRKAGKRRTAGEQDRMIVEVLAQARGPVSAYEIIDRLRSEATLAPQTVYRALDRLIAAGSAHRLESLNAFVACSHKTHKGAALFAICEDCRMVTEFDDETAVGSLGAWARRTNFTVRAMTLELRGRCRLCAAKAEAGT